MVRLSAQVISDALSYINPIGERELDLRGKRIQVIENLGATSSDCDCIDFTDNEIAVLGGFPHRPRQTTLLLARNRLQQISPQIATSLPSLHSLVLAQNNIKELADVDPLGRLTKLTTLVLMENPIASKENYRLWIIWRCPTVRFLDYRRVRDVERNEAKTLFGTAEEPTPLANQIMGLRTNTFDIPTAAPTGPSDSITRLKLTVEERGRVEKALERARSLEEIDRLEQMLKEGKIPGAAI
ncbi:uncharacterized protein K452DRAFT_285691 [Aplosporella prunicola CBS 121167]|uniref:U2 small nuclear ribonucleoprotein A' n=1 Tax=Aplosporella prunicola CBS 121167 TaxID=1176127 RepID=A0A6A6BM91_9PEZI|nr:uncharacterized protein K452DRAFT_285691 [Aplosporella prunicola CBS 121167]KAF2143661.1 hypothetical protein K452DRAFT_285691 [Aplosporella prunicola CBS 121167]